MALWGLRSGSAAVGAIRNGLVAECVLHRCSTTDCVFRQTVDGFTTAIMVVISVCFLPASYAIFVVKERAVKAKHQQASDKLTCLKISIAYGESAWKRHHLAQLI